MTYGDGLANVDITGSIAFHKAQGKLATLTSVPPVSRFGALQLNGPQVTAFQEKPLDHGGQINGGFFVLEQGALDTITDDAQMFEREPIEALVAQGQLNAYQHIGFWQPMDTLRDKQHLEELWQSGKAPWKTW
jgi:glucose-1-phosphate cytidylyltransferase